MNSAPKKPADSQLAVILRAAAGAYLLYLSWGLRGAAFSGEGFLYPLALAVFGAAGIALLYGSVRKLYEGDFQRPGQDDPSGEEHTEGEDSI